MKIIELLNDLLEKSGADDLVKASINEAVKDVDIELNDEDVKPFNALLSIDAAKSNYELKTYFVNKAKADILDPVDKKITALAEEIGGKELVTTLSNEVSTYKKQELLQEAITKKIKEKPTGASDELRKQYEEAQEQINSLKVEKEQALSEAEKEVNRVKTNLGLQSVVSSVKWNDAYLEEDRFPIFQRKLSQKLEDIGADLVVESVTNGVPKLSIVNKSDPQTKVFIDNKEVDFSAVSNMVMSPYIKKTPDQRTESVLTVNTGASDNKESIVSSSVNSYLGEFLNT